MADLKRRTSMIEAAGDFDDKDHAQAFSEIQKAAEAGHADAQFNLGVMYWNGTGVAENDATAIEYFKMAAALGQEDAQNALVQLGIR